MNSNELAKYLKTLPVKKRLSYAQQNKACIQDGRDLAIVLSALNENDLLTFAKENLVIVHHVSDLQSVLQVLNESDKVDFAIAAKKAIRGVYDLLLLLEKLPEKDRFKVAAACEDLYKNGDDIAMIAPLIDKADVYNFCVKFMHVIDPSSNVGMYAIKAAMPPDDASMFGQLATRRNILKQREHVENANAVKQANEFVKLAKVTGNNATLFDSSPATTPATTTPKANRTSLGT